jgi:Uma2 family endonuclease
MVLPAIPLPTIELPIEDGIPLDTPWHRATINLLIELIRYFWRGRTDFYTGGDMFIYYSLEQAVAVKREADTDVVPPPDKRAYRGPDFFVVKDVDGTRYRDTWVVWEESGRYPDLIIELLSPSTSGMDKTIKKRLYERTFHTAEYYCYDPTTEKLIGWRLQGERYKKLTPGPEGRLWSEVLGLWIGTWEGMFQQQRAVWLRFFDANGRLVPTEAEAEAEARQAAEERAAEAQAELERVRTELARLRGESS